MMIAGFRSNDWKAKGRLGLALLAGVGAVLLASCGGVPRTRYYTVAVPAPAPANTAKTSLVLDVPRFQAAEVLRDDRILYYHSPTELNYYEYHRWTTYPADMMAEQVARRLRAMGVFSEVRLFSYSASGDYILRGRLLNFDELDYEAGGMARVGLELSLVRTRDNKMVWSGTREASQPIHEKGVAGVVKALNTAAVQVLDQLLPELASETSREVQQAPGQSQ